jgi:hypothetical protein
MKAQRPRKEDKAMIRRAKTPRQMMREMDPAVDYDRMPRYYNLHAATRQFRLRGHSGIYKAIQRELARPGTGLPAEVVETGGRYRNYRIGRDALITYMYQRDSGPSPREGVPHRRHVRTPSECGT